MNPVHNLFPNGLMIAGICQLPVILIISGPDSGCVVIRKAYKPCIPVACRGSALSCSRHPVQMSPGTGGTDGNPRSGKNLMGFQRIRHGICQKECRFFLQNLFGICFPAKDYIAVPIQNRTVKFRLCINAAVGNRCIGPRQLQVCNAKGQSAQCRRRRHILRCQCGNPQIPRIFNSRFRSDRLHQRPHCYNIHGINNPVPDIGIAHIPPAAAPPVSERMAAYRIGLIIINRPQRSLPRIQGRSKGRNHLKGRTRLPGHSGGPV